MDLEHLTKKQTILLTFLVSFVTSIATGIVSVSLMQQMPAPITQTINRVVERTLERVVEKKTDAAGVVTTKEKTVFVKETDLISSAVQSALPSLASVYSIAAVPVVAETVPVSSDAPAGSAGQTAAALDTVPSTTHTGESTEKPAEKPTRTFIAHGVFTSDATLRVPARGITEDMQLEVTLLASGVRARVEHIQIAGGVATLTLPKKTGVGIRMGNAQSLQLGATLVSLGGEGRVQVATGLVSDIVRTSKGDMSGISVDGAVVTNGAALIDLEGRLLAMYAGGAWLLQ
jgi:hypothetical protein